MIVGIDLGTTNSLVAWFDGEKAQIIPNRLGELLTPSVVSVDEDADFYISADGNPVVCFGEYEIAPGFMGIQEFEIERPAD